MKNTILRSVRSATLATLAAAGLLFATTACHSTAPHDGHDRAHADHKSDAHGDHAADKGCCGTCGGEAADATCCGTCGGDS